MSENKWQNPLGCWTLRTLAHGIGRRCGSEFVCSPSTTRTSGRRRRRRWRMLYRLRMRATKPFVHCPVEANYARCRAA